MAARIYPVPIKRPSGIYTTWEKWPDDVREILRGWNKRDVQAGKLTSRLGFRRSKNVFKCVDCGEFCMAHNYGAAVLDGDWLCDDCLIDRARIDPSSSLRATTEDS